MNRNLIFLQETRLKPFSTAKGNVFAHILLNKKSLSKFFEDYELGSYEVYIYSTMEKDAIHVSFEEFNDDIVKERFLFIQKCSFNIYVNNHGNVYGRLTFNPNTISVLFKNFIMGKSYSINLSLDKKLHTLVINRDID